MIQNESERGRIMTPRHKPEFLASNGDQVLHLRPQSGFKTRSIAQPIIIVSLDRISVPQQAVEEVDCEFIFHTDWRF
jgi:hypothetical protein